MFCEFGRFETRDARATATACRVSKVRRDGQGLAVLHETQAREVETVSPQDFVQSRPRHQPLELSGATADVQDADAPRGGEKLLRGVRLKHLVQALDARTFRAATDRAHFVSVPSVSPLS